MITVIGSANLDLIATVDRLPRPGETVPGDGFSTAPGGKGANQALAARRAGAVAIAKAAATVVVAEATRGAFAGLIEQAGFRPTQKQAFGGAHAGWKQFLEQLETVSARGGG